MVSLSQTSDATAGRSAAWGAVCSMSLCVFVLIASEFMPVSLLTPIARDLAVSEGQAGQSIAISGIFAVLTSLFLTSVIGNLDRKIVLLSMTALMAVSGVVVALAPNYLVLMIGRALIGVVIGGFWSMSTATVMRLVPEDAVPKALAIISAGNALAASTAAPLGSFLGAYIGWRGAFFSVVPLAVVALIWQWIALPSLKKESSGSSSPFGALAMLRQPIMAAGMLAVLLMFMGQYGVYTYFRPFLETVTQADVSTISLMLLAVGVAGLVGTIVVGRILDHTVYGFVIAVPLLLALAALALIPFGTSAAAVFVIFGIWGLVSTPSSVGWFTWLSRAVPSNAEAGGGLIVATIQFAITLGAAGGGILYDTGGANLTFLVSAVVLVAAALAAAMTAYLGTRGRT